MLKKTMTFKDVDGNPVTEDFYFNLNKAEIAELEMSYDGGLSKHLTKIIESDPPDGKAIMDTFKQILMLSVGKRSEDAKRFIKSPEITNEFMQTEAYSDFFIELCTDANAGANFINGIMPADLAEMVKEGKTLTDIPLPEQPAWVTEGRVPTVAELENATPDLMRLAFQRQNEAKQQSQ